AALARLGRIALGRIRCGSPPQVLRADRGRAQPGDRDGAHLVAVLVQHDPAGRAADERKAIVTHEAQHDIDRYLARLRRSLRGIAKDDAGEILEEIRSHLLDRAAASGPVTADSVARAIAALGSPEDIAVAYLMDDLSSRARVSRSPWLILRSL